MILENTSQQAKIQYTGRETVVIPGGKNLKIETAPDGKEILNAPVPVGKTWTVHFSIEIVED